MAEAYPLYWPTGWKRTLRPKTSRFGKWNKKPTVYETSLELLGELRRLTGSSECIISTNVPLKNNGLPYSNFREPDDCGVAVYFNYNKQDMVIACDTFDRVGCNMYAIVKTIEAMRGIERWGCSELLQRAFTGFKALPQSKEWWEVLGIERNAEKNEVIRAYRNLAKKYHPDAGGNNNHFTEINEAYQQGLKNAV